MINVPNLLQDIAYDNDALRDMTYHVIAMPDVDMNTAVLAELLLAIHKRLGHIMELQVTT